MDGINNYNIAMIAVFIFGYVLITIEHWTQINKATCALLMAIICWSLQFVNAGFELEQHTIFFGHGLVQVSQIVFFLLGALAIVEMIDAHQGFQFISNKIEARSKKKLLWVMGVVTFVLSGVLDNLTTTVLMISLLKKTVGEGDDRLLIGGGIVIAANAGGAWTPIGDITTTMLWIGGQLSTAGIIKSLFIPSVICLTVALGCLSLMLKGNFSEYQIDDVEQKTEPFQNSMFFLGLGALVFVPVFKAMTGLPPFMGIFFGLSLLWIITDILHYGCDERRHLKMPHILAKIDLSTVLFFLGILLCISALETADILQQWAEWLDIHIGDVRAIAALIGLASAVIDNVPLVAASMGMYSIEQFAPDSMFWQLIAYCAGTGGSTLIIGSAAGVAFMSLEKVDFFWFLKKITLPALIGYLAGMGVYLLIFG